MSKQINQISIDKIFPHPKNPRTDIGDISELTESIKANGIYQNLTVVPKVSNGTTVDGFYTVIIGHRRLAAATAAGLDSVPCVITEMSESEQIATMLAENIHRSELTAFEQAKGFQMMFDLGESTRSVSKKTGFSETTIRNRTSLLKLSEDKFKDATERGATLQDFAEINAIEAPELREMALEAAGTVNFKSTLMKARDIEILRKNKPWVISQLEMFAEKAKDLTNKVFVGSYEIKTQTMPIKIPDDAGHIKYYYTEAVSRIYLYKDKIKTLEEIKRDEKAEEQRRNRDVLEEISQRAYKLRYDFIDNYPGRSRDSDILLRQFGSMFFGDNEYIHYDKKLLAELMETKGKNFDAEYIKEYYSFAPEQALVFMVYSVLESENGRYYDRELCHTDNKKLNNVYEFLMKLGYQLSDEEKSLKDGTHELLTR